MSVMQTNTGSTLLRRQIGRKLEQLRRAAGLTMEQAAERLDRARATLHRIENGADNVRFRPMDVEQMLKLYAASPEDAEIILAMTAETREIKSWWHDFNGSPLPAWFQPYVGLQESAATIRQYSAEVVPGLLQTRAYADEVFRMPGGAIDPADDAGRDQSVSVRVERQRLLTRFAAPQFDVMITEGALRQRVGGPAVMAEQLGHLIKASKLDNISIRVLPFAGGLHAGAVGGAFSILDFPPARNSDEPEPPVVYTERVTGALYLDKPREVRSYNEVWNHMIDRALSESDSADLIETFSEEHARA